MSGEISSCSCSLLFLIACWVGGRPPALMNMALGKWEFMFRCVLQFYTLGSKQNGFHFQKTFLKTFSCKSLPFQLSLHSNVFPGFTLVMCQHCVRQGLAVVRLRPCCLTTQRPFLNQYLPNSMTRYGMIRPHLNENTYTIAYVKIKKMKIWYPLC